MTATELLGESPLQSQDNNPPSLAEAKAALIKQALAAAAPAKVAKEASAGDASSAAASAAQAPASSSSEKPQGVALVRAKPDMSKFRGAKIAAPAPVPVLAVEEALPVVEISGPGGSASHSRLAAPFARAFASACDNPWSAAAALDAALLTLAHSWILANADAAAHGAWQKLLGLIALAHMLFVGAFGLMQRLPKSWQRHVRAGHIPMALTLAVAVGLHCELRMGGPLTKGISLNFLTVFVSGWLLKFFQLLAPLRTLFGKITRVSYQPRLEVTPKQEVAGATIDRLRELWTDVHKALTISLLLLVLVHVLVVLIYWYRS